MGGKPACAPAQYCSPQASPSLLAQTPSDGPDCLTARIAAAARPKERDYSALLAWVIGKV